MKIAVFNLGNGYTLGNPQKTDESHFSFVGYIDLPIEKPKKTWKDAVDLGENCECGTCRNRYCKCAGRNPDGSFGKKTVVKDGTIAGISQQPNFQRIKVRVPLNAKNIKCTYEAEE